MLEPFNFPGHGTGADLESAARMKQAGRETALRGQVQVQVSFQTQRTKHAVSESS